MTAICGSSSSIPRARAAPPEGIFTAPEFRHHITFVGGLRDCGVLVAAGPLPDSDGTGMTIVHVPNLATAQDVVRSAQLGRPICRGLLEVRIRPWRVVMSA